MDLHGVLKKDQRARDVNGVDGHWRERERPEVLRCPSQMPREQLPGPAQLQPDPSWGKVSPPHAGTHLEVPLEPAGVACHRTGVGMEDGPGLGKGPVPPSQEFPLQEGRDTELDYWRWLILRKTVEELRKEQPCF